MHQILGQSGFVLIRNFGIRTELTTLEKSQTCNFLKANIYTSTIQNHVTEVHGRLQSSTWCPERQRIMLLKNMAFFENLSSVYFGNVVDLIRIQKFALEPNPGHKEDLEMSKFLRPIVYRSTLHKRVREVHGCLNCDVGGPCRQQIMLVNKKRTLFKTCTSGDFASFVD